MPVPPLPPRSSLPYAPPRRRGFWPVLRGIGHAFNLLRLAIINVVFFTFLLAFLLLIAGGIAGSRENRSIAAGSVLVLKPEGQLVEQFSIDPMQRAMARLSGDEAKQVRVRDLIAAIDAAATDQRIGRIWSFAAQRKAHRAPRRSSHE